MNPGARGAGRRLLVQYKFADEKISAVVRDMNASCKRGCAHCCYQLVGMSVIEAIPIAERVIVTKDVDLKKRLQVEADHVDTLGGIYNADREKFFREHRPCVFLRSDNDCAIYAERPMACRAYFVVSDPILCGPEGRGQEVFTIGMHKASNKFTTQAMLDEYLHSPPVVESLPRAVLLAIDLLEQGTKPIDEWLEKHPDAELPLAGLQAYMDSQ